MRLAPVWALLCGGTASLIVLFGLLYLMRVLEPIDRTRFNAVTRMLPRAIAGPLDKFLLLLIRSNVAGVEPVSI
jgi:hypothetical protein